MLGLLRHRLQTSGPKKHCEDEGISKDSGTHPVGDSGLGTGPASPGCVSASQPAMHLMSKVKADTKVAMGDSSDGAYAFAPGCGSTPNCCYEGDYGFMGDIHLTEFDNLGNGDASDGVTTSEDLCSKKCREYLSLDDTTDSGCSCPSRCHSKSPTTDGDTCSCHGSDSDGERDDADRGSDVGTSSLQSEVTQNDDIDEEAEVMARFWDVADSREANDKKANIRQIETEHGEDSITTWMNMGDDKGGLAEEACGPAEADEAGDGGRVADDETSESGDDAAGPGEETSDAETEDRDPMGGKEDAEAGRWVEPGDDKACHCDGSDDDDDDDDDDDETEEEEVEEGGKESDSSGEDEAEDGDPATSDDEGEGENESASSDGDSDAICEDFCPDLCAPLPSRKSGLNVSPVTGSYPSKKFIKYARQAAVPEEEAEAEAEAQADTDDDVTYFDLFADEDVEDHVLAALVATSKVPSVNAVYAMPRDIPTDINDVMAFWELDFQVGRRIVPCMGSWERLDMVPDRRLHPKDFYRYSSYKTLYTKWLRCHKNQEQWYRRFGWRSLANVLKVNHRREKRYPEQCQTASHWTSYPEQQSHAMTSLLSRA